MAVLDGGWQAWLAGGGVKPFHREAAEERQDDAADPAGDVSCWLTDCGLYWNANTEKGEALTASLQSVLSDADDTPVKEQVEAIHAVMEKLGGSLEDTIVFEDALYAIKSAKQGGFTVYAIEDSVMEGERDEIMVLADRYITSYAELL